MNRRSLVPSRGTFRGETCLKGDEKKVRTSRSGRARVRRFARVRDARVGRARGVARRARARAERGRVEVRGVVAGGEGYKRAPSAAPARRPEDRRHEGGAAAQT